MEDGTLSPNLLGDFSTHTLTKHVTRHETSKIDKNKDNNKDGTPPHEDHTITNRRKSGLCLWRLTF